MLTPTAKTRRRGMLAAGALALSTTGALVALPASTAVASASTLPRAVQITPSGLPAGSIKHVWLIILENKSYDATFTGLNNNSYLWKTLPSQGVLLKNYYGTGHSSQDNYIAMVSGQAPEEDVQQDCSVQDYDFGSASTTVTDPSSPNFGQVASAAGPNHTNGQNGCTYPTTAPTLFNQLDSAGDTWKVYNQDQGGASPNSPTAAPNGSSTISFKPGSDVTNRDASYCGGPGSSSNFPGAPQTSASLTGSTVINSPSSYGVTSFTGAQADDQYVAKHNPAPWFHSLIGTSANPGTGITTPAAGGTDCANVVNLDDPNKGLVHDLGSESTTPAFSWITPNNCSDAHDAVCKGNNLSGAFDSNGNPIYTTTPQAYDPESTTPTNYTGGLYASDLFLKYYIPLIEKSAAFKDGGLIDVTFDEANPPFTYSGNSFNNQPYTGANGTGDKAGNQQGDTTQPSDCAVRADGTTVAQPCTPTTAYAPGESSVYAGYGIYADAAGQNINGQNQNTEPTGPNSTLGTDGSGNQLYPGPGNNAFIDRPTACTNTGGGSGSAPLTVTAPATCVLGGGNHSPGARTDSATGSSSSSTITDGSIQASDTGRLVTDTTDTTGTGTNNSPIPPNTFVGSVTDAGPTTLTANSGSPYSGSFQLVDANGNPVTPTGAVTKVTLSAEGAPGSQSSTTTVDPLYDATDATPGGGDTGSVLISPYITPGTSTTTYYNHYSWLRTMEDLFDVGSAAPSSTNNPVFLTDSANKTYTVAGGLDGLGHLGFAAQTGLTGFGADVFNNPAGNTPNPIDGVGTNLPEAPLALTLPLVAMAALAVLLVLRRRQQRRATVSAGA